MGRVVPPHVAHSLARRLNIGPVLTGDLRALGIAGHRSDHEGVGSILMQYSAAARSPAFAFGGSQDNPVDGAAGGRHDLERSRAAIVDRQRGGLRMGWVARNQGAELADGVLYLVVDQRFDGCRVRFLAETISLTSFDRPVETLAVTFFATCSEFVGILLSDCSGFRVQQAIQVVSGRVMQPGCAAIRFLARRQFRRKAGRNHNQSDISQ